MTFLTTAQILTRTDRLAGEYEAQAAALPALVAKLAADVTAIYGDGTAAIPSLGDPVAIGTLGPAALAAYRAATSPAPFALALSGGVSALSSYLKQSGGAAAGLPPAVGDVASCLRYANGCPDPSPAGKGAGSSYASLAHPSYAALVSLLTGGGSALPPDAVFAPTGLVLASYALPATNPGYAAGLALLTAGSAPYAPAGPGLFAVRCGRAPSRAAPAPGQPPPPLAGQVPDGSLFVVLTGVNQAGRSVTWRGDIGTGLAALGQVLPASALVGAAGGANGGTAAQSDRLAGVTGIAPDPARASSATKGDFDVITLAARSAL